MVAAIESGEFPRYTLETMSSVSRLPGLDENCHRVSCGLKYYSDATPLGIECPAVAADARYARDEMCIPVCKYTDYVLGYSLETSRFQHQAELLCIATEIRNSRDIRHLTYVLACRHPGLVKRRHGT